MTFFIENKLFIMSTLLLAALVAGASSLQGARDARDAAQAPVVQAVAAQAGQDSVAAVVSSAPGATEVSSSAVQTPEAPAPADISVSEGSDMSAAPRPAVQGVRGDDDDEEEDD